MAKLNEIFGRAQQNGNVMLFYKNDGELVTSIDDSEPQIWPEKSNLSAYYDHEGGIEITAQDANELGIDIE